MLLVEKEQTSKWKSMGKPKVLDSEYKRLGQIKGLSLYHYASDRHSQFHAVDHLSLHRYMGYFKRTALAGVDGWAQIAVQRHSEIKRVGLPEIVFFEHALIRHTTLFSDVKQTDAGRYLWEVKLIPAALYAGFYVYAFDDLNQSFRRIKRAGVYPVELWSDKRGNNNRLVISLRPLRRY